MLKTRKPLKVIYIISTILAILLVFIACEIAVFMENNHINSTETYEFSMLNLIFLFAIVEIVIADITMIIIDLIKSIMLKNNVKIPVIFLIANSFVIITGIIIGGIGL